MCSKGECCEVTDDDEAIAPYALKYELGLHSQKDEFNTSNESMMRRKKQQRGGFYDRSMWWDAESVRRKGPVPQTRNLRVEADSFSPPCTQLWIRITHFRCRPNSNFRGLALPGY
jgi:hypothetical protein